MAKTYYNLYIDGLKYYLVIPGKKKAQSVFFDLKFLEKKVDSIRAKHPRWHCKIVEREL